MKKNSYTDDKECLEALQYGDGKALECLFVKYQPQLIHFVNGFIKDMDASRDLVQDVFLRLWQNHNLCGNISSIKSYLFTMTRNAIYNWYDHMLVTEKYKTENLLQPVVSECTEEIVFANQLMQIISATLEAMPAQRKKIFKMSREDGMSNSEIALKLNISKRTVENHLTLALRDLRKTMKAFILLFI